MTAPFNLSWGILATGRISHTFVGDLLMPPSTRSVSDVSHTLAAVASSSSISKAEAFINDFSKELQASGQKVAPKPYGSYAELLKDEGVKAVYIGSPHSDHYKTCMAALRAGKHVLCEVRQPLYYSCDLS
jgi:predicted dehydrogenase